MERPNMFKIEGRKITVNDVNAVRNIDVTGRINESVVPTLIPTADMPETRSSE